MWKIKVGIGMSEQLLVRLTKVGRVQRSMSRGKTVQNTMWTVTGARDTGLVGNKGEFRRA